MKADEARAKIEVEMDQKTAITDEERPFCEICYTNQIVPAGTTIAPGDNSTVEFECGHRFCSECTLE